jgi:cytochrome c
MFGNGPEGGNMRTVPGRIFGALLWAGALLPAHAALSFPGCPDVANGDFHVTPIAGKADTVAEPLKMAFDLVAQPGEDAKDKVDVYFVERYGKLRKFDARQNKVITIAKMPVTVGTGTSSDGLIGLALDPGFKSNHWIYLYYTFVGGGESVWRLSRFTLDAGNEHIDLKSEIVVLKIPIKAGSLHASGAMEFDAYGDLWVTVSNDMVDEVGDHPYPVWSSGNTNDLRGKILRIHPTPEGKYTIPEGNLFKPGTPKTLPEIYVMGLRNPYTLSVDPVRRWLVWGDVGPNKLTNPDGSAMLVEEGNLAVSPGNFGYPFFVGPNQVIKKGMDPAKPVIPASADWNGVAHGLDTLPPAIPAIHPYHESVVMNGPIYRYDGDLNSSIKFPPHFSRKWILTDFKANVGNPVVAVTVSDDGKKQLAEDTILKALTLHKPLEIKAGPDGALYVVNYDGYRTVGANTGLVRIEYTGSCRPAEPKLEKPTALAMGGRRAPTLSIRQGQVLMVAIETEGEFSLRVTDLAGRLAATREGRGRATLELREARGPGVYLLSLRTSGATLVRKVFLD